MTDTPLSQGPRPSRRTALKTLGGAVATGGAALVTTGITAPAAADATASHDRIPKDLKPGGALDRLAADLASKDEFSGTLLLTHRKRTVLSRSFGMANRQEGIRNGPHTRFVLGSVTKMLTATAIHQLVGKNKLTYADRVGDHLDGFPAKIAGTVTVHHLLTHSSGLGNFTQFPGYMEEAQTWDSAEEVLTGAMKYLRRSELGFAPGTANSYSNSGYCLLGAIAAAASGKPYYDYMAEHIFKAAGMRDSAFYTKPQWRADPRIAHTYHKKPGTSEWTDGLEEHTYIGLPAGGSFATCADLESYAHALLDDKLMDSPYTSLMLGAKGPKLSPQPEPGGSTPSTPPSSQSPTLDFAAYGAGALLVNGQWVHGKNGGSTFGTSCNIDFFPGSGWVVVVLGNGGNLTCVPIVEMARRLIVEQ